MDTNAPASSWVHADSKYAILDKQSSTAQQPSIEWASVTESLIRLLSLNDDWDGEGSQSPSAEVVDSVVYLLQRLARKGFMPPPTRAAPLQGGGVIIEWQALDMQASVEVTSPFRFEWLIERVGEEPSFYVDQSVLPSDKASQRIAGSLSLSNQELLEA